MLSTLSDSGLDVYNLDAHLDFGHRVGLEVVQPVRVSVGARLRCENGVSAVNRLIHQWAHTVGAALRTLVVEEKKRCALERASNFAFVFSELRDDVVVPITHADS